MAIRVLKPILALVGIALALAGCGSGFRQEVRIVGSSTVFPFSRAVAERLTQNFPYPSPIVESTGTGSGIKLFCNGVGGQHPDIVNASRRFKKSELETCARNGVRQIIEIPIGIDGLVLIESATRRTNYRLTLRDIYAALAKRPFGREQTAQTWRDVNPELPDVPILVYGPPPSSGTRDSFVELMLTKGCDSDPAMKALAASDADRHTALCHQLREDGRFVEAGENDNLLIQRVSENQGAVGILGYSFMEENLDRVTGIPINGLEPTVASIQSLQYPGARTLYIYVKGEHLNVVPGLREFLTEYTRGWAPDSYLQDRGLIPAPDAARAAAAEAVLRPRPLTLRDLG